MTGVRTDEVEPNPVRRPGGARRVPGDPSSWVLLLGDMTLFTVLFSAFLTYRRREPAVFVAGQDGLSKNIGLVNTLVLLASSFLVVGGLHALRTGRHGRARASLWAAAGCGVAFAVIKAVEWRAVVAEGHTVTSNVFYTMYFALTGIHLAHVVIGAAALITAATAVEKCRPGSRPFAYAETATCFWHMVDLIWLVLFPLLYLVR